MSVFPPAREPLYCLSALGASRQGRRLPSRLPDLLKALTLPALLQGAAVYRSCPKSILMDGQELRLQEQEQISRDSSILALSMSKQIELQLARKELEKVGTYQNPT